MLQIQSKRFYLDVKQNRRGRFIKVAEVCQTLVSYCFKYFYVAIIEYLIWILLNMPYFALNNHSFILNAVKLNFLLNFRLYKTEWLDVKKVGETFCISMPQF